MRTVCKNSTKTARGRSSESSKDQPYKFRPQFVYPMCTLPGTGPCHHPRGTFESMMIFRLPDPLPLSEVIGQPSKARNWNSEVSLFFRSIRIERNMLTQHVFFPALLGGDLGKSFLFFSFAWEFLRAKQPAKRTFGKVPLF